MTVYRAKRLPAHRGPAGWDIILPPRMVGAPLETNQTADFVIIGGGFAGLAAARRLTQLASKSKIVILEASHIAEGASGRNSGFMIDLPHELTSEDYAGAGDDKTIIKLNRMAQAFGADAVAQYGINPNFFDPSGKINAAVDAAAQLHNETYAKHLAALGEACEPLDAQTMREITGSPYYQSGLFTPGTVMLQPAGFVRGMADGLRTEGVEIFENSPVTGFAQSGKEWAVQTDRATIIAPKLILSVNGHLESFGIKRGRLMHVFLFGALTPDLDADALKRLGGHPRWAITPSDPMGTSMRRIDTPQGGNRILTRSCAALHSNMRPNASDLSRAARVMQHKFDDRFPQLAGLKMAHIWAGQLCLTRNSVTVTGEIDHGVYSACAQNGLGTARGTLTGIAAAELACEITSEITEYFVHEAEPKKLPPQPFRDIGANIIMRRREWIARHE